MKKLLLITIIFLNLGLAFANPLTRCIKKYNIDSERAYIMSYTAIKNLNYTILEIQSESGYILFSAGNREYLLEVSSVGNESYIKVTPADSDLSNITIPENVLKTLDSEILKVK